MVEKEFTICMGKENIWIFFIRQDWETRIHKDLECLRFWNKMKGELINNGHYCKGKEKCISDNNECF